MTGQPSWSNTRLHARAIRRSFHAPAKAERHRLGTPRREQQIGGSVQPSEEFIPNGWAKVTLAIALVVHGYPSECGRADGFSGWRGLDNREQRPLHGRELSFEEGVFLVRFGSSN